MGRELSRLFLRKDTIDVCDPTKLIKCVSEKTNNRFSGELQEVSIESY